MASAGPLPLRPSDLATSARRLTASISTFSLYPLPLQLALPLIAMAGFDGIELVAPPVVSARVATRISRLARSHNLAIQSVHQTLFGYGPLLPLTRRMADAIELALAVGAPRVVVHGPHTATWNKPAAARWLETIQRLNARAAQAKLVISIENVDKSPVSDAPIVLGEIGALASFAEGHGLGVTLDTCHATRNGDDLVESYELLRPRLVNIHLSDRKGLGRGERHPALRTVAANHLFPGEGQAPLEPLLARLAADGYTGPVTVEVNPWALRPWSPDACRSALERAVAYIRRAEQAAST